jgi:hypothetical protein
LVSEVEGMSVRLEIFEHATDASGESRLDISMYYQPLGGRHRLTLSGSSQ